MVTWQGYAVLFIAISIPNATYNPMPVRRHPALVAVCGLYKDDNELILDKNPRAQKE